MKPASRRIALGVSVLGTTCVLGTIGYRLSGFGWIDSLYMVVITVFSVGFGEIHELGPGMRVFTMFLIVSGCSSLIYIMGGFFQMVAEGELNEALGNRRMMKEIDNITKHVIICGFGRIGRVLVAELQQEKLPIVVVDTSEERRRDALQRGLLVVAGDATSDDTLRRAGIQRARALATVLPNDALNVFITLTARHLNPQLFLVARGEDHSTEEKLLRAGADRVVLPSAIGAERMAQMIAKPGVLEFFQKADLGAVGQELSSIGIAMQEVIIEKQLIGRTVAELEGCGAGGYLVLAVRRIGGSLVHNPDHDFRFAEEDRVLLMGHRESLPNLERAFAALALHSNRRAGQPLRGA